MDHERERAKYHNGNVKRKDKSTELSAGRSRPQCYNVVTMAAMRLLGSILFPLPLLFYSPQEKTKWRRLYTYEDSTVEVDASNISFALISPDGSDFALRFPSFNRWRVSRSDTRVSLKQ
jgi:hypothetical protein